MPDVLSYTPAWLSRPNPGHDIFPGPSKAPVSYHATWNTTSASLKRKAKPGPRRVIAHRGTEVFVAVGREIRWSDLVSVKETWEAQQRTGRGSEQKGKNGGKFPQEYRVCLHFNLQSMDTGGQLTCLRPSKLQLPKILDN